MWLPPSRSPPLRPRPRPRSPALAAEAPEAAVEITREEWIAARVSEFQTDPAVRDRAIATILYATLSLDEHVGKAFGFMAENPGMLKGLGGLLGMGRKAKDNGA